MSKRFNYLKKFFNVKSNRNVRRKITFMNRQFRIARKNSLSLYSRLHVKHGKEFRKELRNQ